LILGVLSSVYGAAASWRRRWYARDPSRQHKLTRPVISVGNLRVGGTGKTPVVAHVCELLQAHGERPSILSRGYGRTRAVDGVTVVSDGKEIVADLASAGDEPLMLARRLPSVPVLVGTNRFECGQRAERDFDVTVHVLDDGFQHVALARAVDLLLVDEHDLDDRVLPAGRLREPLANAAAAHALLVTAGDSGSVAHVAQSLRVPVAFQVLRAIHTPHWLDGQPAVHGMNDRVLAFAGIARPERFFSDLTASGRIVAEKMPFGDHHPFTQKDVDAIVERARASHLAFAITTEKDAVRLEGLTFKGLPVQIVPLTVTIERSAQFQHWLFDRLGTRTAHPAHDTAHPEPRTSHQP
jgi:tetraacyldisaccharide 4'-kinase